MNTKTVNSIYDLAPLEYGGTENRKGIDFQDHIAADFCLDMILGNGLEEVWCETQDDITLIWKRDEKIEVEFVQVKNNTSFTAWSTSILCDRKGKGIGHSILEKSLANDRCEEKCCFRIITAQSVNDDLKILTYDIKSLSRNSMFNPYDDLNVDLDKRVNDFKSQNGNDYKFWVENIQWDVRYAADAIEDKAVRKLRRFLEEQGFFPAEDQLGEIYRRLTGRVYRAGLADYKIKPLEKRINKAELTEWLIKITNEALHPALKGTNKMIEKMKLARLPDDTIEAAREQRRFYREEVLRPKYLNLTERNLVEAEVLSILQRLKSKLDTGAISLSGSEFHEKCLEQLDGLRQNLPLASRIPLFILHGSMYDIVNRCLHRFRRVG